jgi:hypothetical protein
MKKQETKRTCVIDETVEECSWTLTIEKERTLAVFERKILPEICEPVKGNELWRI